MLNGKGTYEIHSGTDIWCCETKEEAEEKGLELTRARFGKGANFSAELKMADHEHVATTRPGFVFAPCDTCGVLMNKESAKGGTL